MAPLAAQAALPLAGIWSDTFGLVFTFVLLMPALATALVIVAVIGARGEKRDNEHLRGRWGRRTRPPSAD